MNEELQTRITAYLDAIESSASRAGDFVVEQTPLVAQEYLAWVWMQSAICIAACIAGMIATFVFATFVYWLAKKDNVDASAVFLVMLVGWAFLCVPLTAAGVAPMIKVTVAPRVVLLEKIAEVMP